MADFNLPGGETPDEGELSAELPPSPAGDDSRLGIKHLLVWTALCGVYLANTRLLATQIKSVQLDIGWQISVVIHSLSYGALLAVPLMWWTRRRSKPRFPTHPGEWIWVIRGLPVLLWQVWDAVHSLYHRWSASEVFNLNMGIIVWIYGASLILLGAIAVFRLKRPVRWRALLMVCVLLDIAAGILLFASYNVVWWDTSVMPWRVFAEGSQGALTVVLAIGLAVWDWRANEKYPRTHWVGVAIVIWGILTSGLQIALEWAASRNAL